jgi:hypothetical protein
LLTPLVIESVLTDSFKMVRNALEGFRTKDPRKVALYEDLHVCADEMYAAEHERLNSAKESAEDPSSGRDQNTHPSEATPGNPKPAKPIRREPTGTLIDIWNKAEKTKTDMYQALRDAGHIAALADLFSSEFQPGATNQNRDELAC